MNKRFSEMFLGGASNRREIQRKSNKITVNKRNKIKSIPIKDMMTEMEGSIEISCKTIKELRIKKGIFETTLRIVDPLKEIKIQLNKKQIEESKIIINKIKKTLNNSEKYTDKNKE